LLLLTTIVFLPKHTAVFLIFVVECRCRCRGDDEKDDDKNPETKEAATIARNRLIQYRSWHKRLAFAVDLAVGSRMLVKGKEFNDVAYRFIVVVFM
jgi:hypothetical protein